MTWLPLGQSHISAPYRIVRGIAGYECWCFSRNQSGILGREIETLDKAKALCEKHKESHRHP